MVLSVRLSICLHGTILLLGKITAHDDIRTSVAATSQQRFCHGIFSFLHLSRTCTALTFGNLYSGARIRIAYTYT